MKIRERSHILSVHAVRRVLGILALGKPSAIMEVVKEEELQRTGIPHNVIRGQLNLKKFCLLNRKRQLLFVRPEEPRLVFGTLEGQREMADTGRLQVAGFDMHIRCLLDVLLNLSQSVTTSLSLKKKLLIRHGD